MDNILIINNISKRYGRIEAVKNLSIQVPKGSIYGVLGPNGSGKTTTLSIILGTIKADEGNFKWAELQENNYFNIRIGALLEKPNFYPYLSVQNNLKIACNIKEIYSNAKEEIQRVLDITQLSNRKNSSFRSLSFGMKQRLAIAALLLGNPSTLILDEPTNGLDPEGIADIRNIIKQQAAEGKTIILASHILDEVEKVCTHVAILKKGMLLSEGKITDILDKKIKILVASDNINLLLDLLRKSELIYDATKLNNDLLITLKENTLPKDINEFAFTKGIVLSKFEVKKSSLEDKFLEMIKKTE